MSVLQALSILAVFLGFFVLAKAADRLVQITLTLGHAFKMSPAVAGATIAAPATSAPELGTALVDVVGGATAGAIGVGTILGSAAFNLAAVLAAIALVSRQPVGWPVTLRECGVYLVSLLALLACFAGVSPLGAARQVSALDGLGLMALYALYVVLTTVVFRTAKQPIEDADHGLTCRRALLELVGLVLLIGLACHLLVEGTSTAATLLGEQVEIPAHVLASLLSLVVLAIGTSVPDLLTSISAGRRGHVSMAVSNAVASNTFDILIGLGLPFLLVGGGSVEPTAVRTVQLLLLLAVIVPLILVWRDPPGRRGAVVLSVAYLGFVGGSIAISL